MDRTYVVPRGLVSEARRVTVGCQAEVDIAIWCGGRWSIVPGREGLHLPAKQPTSNGLMVSEIAKHGDWIVKVNEGDFRVYHDGDFRSYFAEVYGPGYRIERPDDV